MFPNLLLFGIFPTWQSSVMYGFHGSCSNLLLLVPSKPAVEGQLCETSGAFSLSFCLTKLTCWFGDFGEMCTYLHVCVHTYVRVYTYVRVCVHICACVHCVCVCVCVIMYVSVCVLVCVCMCMDKKPSDQPQRWAWLMHDIHIYNTNLFIPSKVSNNQNWLPIAQMPQRTKLASGKWPFVVLGHKKQLQKWANLTGEIITING